MSSHLIETVLFDCDGTLLKSLGLGMEAYNYALEKVEARPHSPDEIKKFFGRSADRIFFELLQDADLAKEAYEYYLEVEITNVDRIIPHDGIPELLKKLKDSGYTLGVVTGRHSRELEFLLRENNLTDYFKVFICDNELENSKPHPEGLLRAIDELNLLPEQALYVGDSVMDLEAANRAKIPGIAALWDEWVRPLEMKKKDPVLMAKFPMEILDWLNERSTPKSAS